MFVMGEIMANSMASMFMIVVIIIDSIIEIIKREHLFEIHYLIHLVDLFIN